jgi:hypothetical protein
MASEKNVEAGYGGRRCQGTWEEVQLTVLLDLLVRHALGLRKSKPIKY